MEKRKIFLKGLKDGIPIGLGYFAVSFSLGIIAKNGGINALVGFIASFFTRASAGEYGVYKLIEKAEPYLDIVVICCITNLRYLLMSTALSQKFSPKTSLFKRILVGFCVTDEIFAISSAYEGYLEPAYTFGAFTISSPLWALGTCLGIIAGNILPTNIVSALSVALYGMFIAIIIPPARKDKAVLVAVIISFLLSYLGTYYIPGIKDLSFGIRTVILTVVIASAVAIIKPINTDIEKTEN